MTLKKPSMPYSLRVGEQRFVAGVRGISSRRKTRKPFVQPPAAAVVNVTGVSDTGEKRERDVAPQKNTAAGRRKERSNDLPQGEKRNLLVAVPLCWPLRSRVDQNHKQDASPRGRAPPQARTCGEVQ